MFNKNKLLSVISLSAILGLFCIPNVLAADIDDLVKPCADCHGKDGASTEPNVPIMGG